MPTLDPTAAPKLLANWDKLWHKGPMRLRFLALLVLACVPMVLPACLCSRSSDDDADAAVSLAVGEGMKVKKSAPNPINMAKSFTRIRPGAMTRPLQSASAEPAASANP